jgi:hypothetical protein
MRDLQKPHFQKLGGKWLLSWQDSTPADHVEAARYHLRVLWQGKGWAESWKRGQLTSKQMRELWRSFEPPDLEPISP